MRKMASVQTVQEIKSIEGADKICAYRINGWWVVDQVGKYVVGDLVVYCEVDSWIPHVTAPFLTKNKIRAYNNVEGNRLKTIRLKGQLSQGLLLPVSMLPMDFVVQVDADASEALGIQKWEPEIPAQLRAQIAGAFPSKIQKTDQERVQNIRNLAEYLQDYWEVTEKLHGTSCTFFYDSEDVGNEFHVCSRNIDLKFDENNTYWQMAIKYDVEKKLAEYCEGERLKHVAVQGEIIGPGINGNQYGLIEPDFFAFTLIENGEKVAPAVRRDVVREVLDLNHVPVITRFNGHIGDHTVESLLELAEGKSCLNDSAREGLVFNSLNDPQKSFKVVSNTWLLKNE